MERNNETSHKMNLLIADLQNAEHIIHVGRAECNKLSEELHSEKAKYKILYLEKITADRRVAELLTACAKSEVLLLMILPTLES
jgi:hypothetical protein